MIEAADIRWQQRFVNDRRALARLRAIGCHRPGHNPEGRSPAQGDDGLPAIER